MSQPLSIKGWMNIRRAGVQGSLDGKPFQLQTKTKDIRDKLSLLPVNGSVENEAERP